MSRRTLFSWIGHADLAAMLDAQPSDERSRLVAALNIQLPAASGLGPTRTLLDVEPFDEVHLFHGAPASVAKAYVRWANNSATAHHIALADPTDYAAVYRAVTAKIDEVLSGRNVREHELNFHLSPGTPAMAAIWLLLAKSQYPARLWQTWRGKAREEKIPFDIHLDVLPQFVRDSDRQLQELALARPSELAGFEDILGESRALRLAVSRAARAAQRDVGVLLLGETGTGKELFARAIHRASRRARGPFVAINCAAVPEPMLESELFGHRKGAFTGADSDRPGAFEEADGGTLFLDEVGECSVVMQQKLLRALSATADERPCARSFRRLGDSKERCVDVRIVSATNRDLVEATRAGTFREDFFYRLAVITVRLPPLRDRGRDVTILAEQLLCRINEGFAASGSGSAPVRLAPSAIRFIKEQRWPGNVRQLHNALLQSAVLCDGPTIKAEDLEAALAELPSGSGPSECGPALGDGFDLRKHLDEIQRTLLARAMREAGGVKSRAARLLGIEHYQTLDAQLERLRVEWK
jgi:DNA-binding NtrC family response regulator